MDDGWLILNGREYREKVQEEMKKARWRRAQAAKRRRMMEAGLDDKPASAAYKMREARAVTALENGDEQKFEQLAST